MTNPVVQKYIKLNEEAYSSLIDVLLNDTVKAGGVASEEFQQARREFYLEAIRKGVELSPLPQQIAQLTPKELVDAAAQLPDRNGTGWNGEASLTAKDRQSFSEAASRRSSYARWDNIFPKGTDNIVLALEGSIQAGDDKIVAYLEQHNAKVEAALKKEQALGQQQERVNKSRKIDKQLIRHNPEDHSVLQVYTPEKNAWQQPDWKPSSDGWKSGPRLGKFLRDRDEWALLDAFQSEMPTGSGGENSQKSEKSQEATTFLLELANRTPVDANTAIPLDRLRVVISRDPQLIGEMSTGQRWRSCMASDGINYHYVPQDIEAGSLVAWAVDKDDLDARYPFARLLLKPFCNEKGEAILVPAKIYGGAGHAEISNTFQATVEKFAATHNAGKGGLFKMDERLYADGQATTILLKDAWSVTDVPQAILDYRDGALQEWLTELKSNSDRVMRGERGVHGEDPRQTLAMLKKNIQRLFLVDTDSGLPRMFFRAMNKSSVGAVPAPALILEALKNNPELTLRQQAFDALRKSNIQQWEKVSVSLPNRHSIALCAALTAEPGTEAEATAIKAWTAELSKNLVLGDGIRNFVPENSAIIPATIRTLEQHISETAYSPWERVKKTAEIFDSYRWTQMLTPIKSYFSEAVFKEILHLDRGQQRLDALGRFIGYSNDQDKFAEAAFKEISILKPGQERLEALGRFIGYSNDKDKFAEAAFKESYVLTSGKNRLDMLQGFVRYSNDKDKFAEAALQEISTLKPGQERLDVLKFFIKFSNDKDKFTEAALAENPNLNNQWERIQTLNDFIQSVNNPDKFVEAAFKEIGSDSSGQERLDKLRFFIKSVNNPDKFVEAALKEIGSYSRGQERLDKLGPFIHLSIDKDKFAEVAFEEISALNSGRERLDVLRSWIDYSKDQDKFAEAAFEEISALNSGRERLDAFASFIEYSNNKDKFVGAALKEISGFESRQDRLGELEKLMWLKKVRDKFVEPALREISALNPGRERFNALERFAQCSDARNFADAALREIPRLDSHEERVEAFYNYIGYSDNPTKYAGAILKEFNDFILQLPEDDARLHELGGVSGCRIAGLNEFMEAEHKINDKVAFANAALEQISSVTSGEGRVDFLRVLANYSDDTTKFSEAILKEQAGAVAPHTVSGTSSSLEGFNNKAGVASIAINLADAALKGDDHKAAEVVAGTDAYSAVMHGDTARATVSGLKTTLYSVATFAGTAGALSAWNPAGWASGTVAVVAGGAAVTIAAGKAIHDNWNTLKRWFGGRNQDASPKTQEIGANSQSHEVNNSAQTAVEKPEHSGAPPTTPTSTTRRSNPAVVRL